MSDVAFLAPVLLLNLLRPVEFVLATLASGAWGGLIWSSEDVAFGFVCPQLVRFLLLDFFWLEVLIASELFRGFARGLSGEGVPVMISFTRRLVLLLVLIGVLFPLDFLCCFLHCAVC